MGLARIAFGSQPSGTEYVLKVPPGSTSLLSLSFIGLTPDPTTAQLRSARAAISTDLSSTFASLLSGLSAGLLAVSDQAFPEFPVSADEKLMVAMEDAGSGVIYFNTAD